MGNYDQILHQKRPFDPKHPPMTIHNRAAQFTPFDALTGFGAKIHETSRITTPRPELSEEQKQVINERLALLAAQILNHPLVTVTWFVPDAAKDGGSYQTITAPVLRIDRYKEQLLMKEAVSIAFDDICTILIEASDDHSHIISP